MKRLWPHLERGGAFCCHLGQIGGAEVLNEDLAYSSVSEIPGQIQPGRQNRTCAGIGRLSRLGKAGTTRL